MRCVRLIHGQGSVLKPELLRWCIGMGIPTASDGANAGSVLIYPRDRTLPQTVLTTTLREKGLQLTPEEEAYLRDPAAIERAREEERRRKREEEKRKLTEAAQRAAQKRQDEAYWQAEVSRLDALDKNRSQANGDGKPQSPVILPPSEIKHQEGYWRAELVRVADTDTDTLKKQKRTGLDKLEPPLPPKPSTPEPPTRRTAPQRDTEADRALFEAEMARLAEDDSIH